MKGQLTHGSGGNVNAYAKPRQTRLQAVITRADGTVENHGTVGYWHRNPIINFFGVIYYRVDNAIRRRYYGVKA